MEPEIALLAQSPGRPREPGSQPIPGYRLIEPLGHGGFGEVWKCEAPGGLFKAIKFVSNLEEQTGPASQEHHALQLVKGIRHPFILSLDRVEIVDGVLVIVMELADRSLHSLLEDYQGRNLPGIPRDELLGYLLEAAEALDWMNFGHDLQHLDIKPHNLFLVSNHLKVADFGLVDRPTDPTKTQPMQRQGGLTPLYAAPELLRGTVSRHCDQYSLAIVYQQLLSGTVPFWCQNIYQLTMLHLTAEPNLTPLPSEDQLVIARALSKKPEERYPSCLDFLQALICGESGAKNDLPRRASTVRKIVSSLPSPASCSTAPIGPETQAKTPLVGRVPVVPSGRDREPSGPASPARPAGSARRGSSSSARTCISLPGYRFLHRTSQTPLGEVWQVEDDRGRPRRALCLPNFVEQDPALIERLRSLNHPALPAREAAWSTAGRLVLVTDQFAQTLRDHLEVCQKQGLPGIPRAELLGYLRTVAEALDALYQQNNLPHLGLNPQTLVLHEETVRVMDFGLVPLIWLPTGQTGGSLNWRYAAPELFDKPDLTGIPPGEATWAALMGRAGSAADQYSLALIYAELLNGLAPQLPRSHPNVPRRSGFHRRVGCGDSGFLMVRGQPRVDLDLLPTYDRPILLRALNDSPEQRFPNCTALVEALERAASMTAQRTDLYDHLPTVIPFASLQGEPPPQDIVLPDLNEVVLQLALPNLGSLAPPRIVVGPQNVRYVLQSSDIWECKCPIQVFSGALALKVQGFQDEWRARITHQSGDSFVFHIDLQPPRSREREDPFASCIAFELDVQAASASAKSFAEVRMRVRPLGGERERIAHLLPELAPRLFDSMRRYLQAGPEQRSEDRWKCPQPLHVYPVLPNLELEEVLDGISRNISLGGVSFRVAKAPRTEQAYLHWHKSATVSPYAVLARIVRVQSMIGGGFEVGASFS